MPDEHGIAEPSKTYVRGDDNNDYEVKMGTDQSPYYQKNGTTEKVSMLAKNKNTLSFIVKFNSVKSVHLDYGVIFPVCPNVQCTLKNNSGQPVFTHNESVSGVDIMFQLNYTGEVKVLVIA